MRLLEIWVKAPMMQGANILIISECIKAVNPKVYEHFAKGRVVLTVCPESSGSAPYGKIASIIRSCKPKSITVLTIDGSPHCFQVHAAVNEAVYILGDKVVRDHYVLLDGVKVVKVSPETIRVARYLSLVESLIKRNPEVLNELEKHSLEHKLAKEVEGRDS